MPPGFPRRRRPDLLADRTELEAIREAIAKYRKDPDAEQPVHYRRQPSQHAARLARKRFWNLARAEGYRIRTQIAQPDQPRQVWELVYQILGPWEGEHDSGNGPGATPDEPQHESVAGKRTPRARSSRASNGRTR